MLRYLTIGVCLNHVQSMFVLLVGFVLIAWIQVHTFRALSKLHLKFYHADCQCALPEGLQGCKSLPSEMKIDYIRLYQVSFYCFKTAQSGCNSNPFRTRPIRCTLWAVLRPNIQLLNSSKLIVTAIKIGRVIVLSHPRKISHLKQIISWRKLIIQLYWYYDCCCVVSS